MRKPTVLPHLAVIARLDRAMQYAETAEIESRSLGVLDAPLQCAIAHKAGHDSGERRGIAALRDGLTAE